MRRLFLFFPASPLLLLSLHSSLSISQPNPDNGNFQWYDEMDPNYRHNETPKTLVLSVNSSERARFGTGQPWLDAYVCMVLDGNDSGAPAEPQCVKIGHWERETQGSEPWIDWKVSYYDLPRGREKQYFLGVNNSVGLGLLVNPSRHFAITEEDGSWPVETTSELAQTSSFTLTTSTISTVTTSLVSFTSSSLLTMSTVTSTSATSPSSETPAQDSSKVTPQDSGWSTTQTGAVSGGVVGGLVVLAAFVICVHRARRHSRLKNSATAENETDPDTRAEMAGNPVCEAESGLEKRQELPGNAIFEAPSPDETGKTVLYTPIGTGPEGNFIYELLVEV